MSPERPKPSDSPIDHIAGIDKTMAAFREDDSPKALQVLREQLCRIAEVTGNDELARLSREGDKDQCMEVMSGILHADMARRAMELE